jgi:hypothetical protein
LDRHFDRIEVIEAESCAVLSTFTEHDFRDAFKKWKKCWEWCIHAEGDYFTISRVMAATRPKVTRSF